MALNRDVILRVNHISKKYPGVTALDDVNLELRRGEVHAIVGENGAGKSTLIKTISGAIEPTFGTIEVEGETFKKMTPQLARKHGIAVIYQEFTLIPVLTAAENIFLGEYLMKGLVLNLKEMDRQSRELFQKLNIEIDPNTMVADLTTGYQQIVEIAKAISKNAKLLIMDEPSAPLTMSEVNAMFKIVDTLKAQGVTIIYISHRLEEIFRLSDRVSVFRDGKYITTMNTAETNKNELIKHMVGRELTESYPMRNKPATETSLSIRKLCGNGVKDITFDVKRGEILGLAGLIGAGRTELMQLLFGYEKITSGEIILDGIDIHPQNCAGAIGMGIALVPEDRKQQGMILDMTIKENITLPILKDISKFSKINSLREEQITQEYSERLRIKAPSMKQQVKNLSGGNQQKVVLAKWLATNPKVMIFDEPTRGIDVGAKQEIYRIMNDLANEGKTIIMVSSDMEELFGMSDRIVVICQGRVTGILKRNEFNQELVLRKSAKE
jgi:ribose transport system ATP-binding protein